MIKSTIFTFCRFLIVTFSCTFIMIILYNIRNIKKYQVTTEINDGITKKQNPEFQKSCLENYLLDEQTFFAEQKGIFNLGTKNAFQAYMFTSFHKVTEVLKVKTCIIEPSILHCMLPVKYKDLLAKRNFPLSNFTRSQNITAFGIMEDDVPILQKEENIHRFRNIGLQPYFVQVPLSTWMTKDIERFKNNKYTSHIFFMYYGWTFHIVIFYRRNNYLWHAALEQIDILNIPSASNLIFANHDAAYENFNFHLALNSSSNFLNIYVPSSPHYFLFQIPNSRFLECNLTRAMYIEGRTNASSSTLEFSQNTMTALRELKTLFKSLLMHFWIFSGTLLGWYRQCDIIPYTSDVDFGAWATEIDDLDYIIQYFQENKTLYIVERMGLQEEALEFQLRCNKLRVDVFFLYKIDNGTWASGHRPSKGYYFRYHYPFFSLCSAELLQEKVQVPCEAEDLIQIEYGDQWMHPVSSWYYESSIHNRGPNIYWDEKIRPKAFERFIH